MPETRSIFPGIKGKNSAGLPEVLCCWLDCSCIKERRIQIKSHEVLRMREMVNMKLGIYVFIAPLASHSVMAVTQALDLDAGEGVLDQNLTDSAATSTEVTLMRSFLSLLHHFPHWSS